LTGQNYSEDRDIKMTLEEKGKRHKWIIDRIKKLTLEIDKLDVERRESYPDRKQWDKQVRKDRNTNIIADKKGGMKNADIARKYSLSTFTIVNIVRQGY